MNDNKKSKIWVYAVILFTSAFIVLLLTAYSQIKLNRNLNDYKNQISHKETENNEYRQNFSSAQEMNVKLNEEIKKLQEENAALKGDILELEKEKDIINKESQDKSAVEEALHTAFSVYLNGNIIECAGMMKKIDSSRLDARAADTYKLLMSKVYSEAGKLLFDEGFSLYNKAKYSDAAVKLQLSSEYAPGAAYSDKCLYYLAYAEMKSGNIVSAVEHMNKLTSNYPESRYLKNAKRFIEKYKQ